MPAPSPVVVFDVNGTLSDMAHLDARIVEVGGPTGAVDSWFARTLRDGFALTASGARADFGAIAIAHLTDLLAGAPGLIGAPSDAAEHVLAGMSELPLHADVAPGMRALHRAGARLVTLSNGPSTTAQALLERAGLDSLLERCLSAADAGAWKPAARSYRYAAEELRVPLDGMSLVAVHPWDIDGARRAGLSTVWINRDRERYPPFFAEPAATVERIGECLEAVGLG